MNRWHRTWQILYGARASSRAHRDFRLPSVGAASLQETRPDPRLDAARRDEETRRRRIGFAITFSIALLFHGALLWPLFASWIFAPSQVRSATSVRYVSASTGRAARGPKADVPTVRLSPPPSEPRKSAPKAEQLPKGQLVTLPASQDERPEHAEYIARDNHRAERETRSRHATQYWKNAAHKPQSEQDARKVQTDASATPQEVPNQMSTPGGGPMGAGLALSGTEGEDASTSAAPVGSALKLPRQREQKRLALKTTSQGTLQNRAERQEQASVSDEFQFQLGQGQALQLNPGLEDFRGVGRSQKGGTGMDGLPGLAALTPSWADLERLAGMPANDDLPEVETDAETRLNAWRWKHSTFFDRIKQAISRNWRGREVYERHDPNRQVYGSQRLITVLQVTLDRQGQIRSLHVREASGSRFLDDEAVRATRFAGPFVNPPEALFGDKDTFSFPFGFVITSQWRHVDFNWHPY